MSPSPHVTRPCAYPVHECVQRIRPEYSPRTLHHFWPMATLIFATARKLLSNQEIDNGFSHVANNIPFRQHFMSYNQKPFSLIK